jgi:hypothetical protein
LALTLIEPRPAAIIDACTGRTASDDGTSTTHATVRDLPNDSAGEDPDGSETSSSTGTLDADAGRKSPKTGVGVTRRRGIRPLPGFIRGIRDIRIPTGDDDTALNPIPATLGPGGGDADLARSDDLHEEERTFDGRCLCDRRTIRSRPVRPRVGPLGCHDGTTQLSPPPRRPRLGVDIDRTAPCSHD